MDYANSWLLLLSLVSVMAERMPPQVAQLMSKSKPVDTFHIIGINAINSKSKLWFHFNSVISIVTFSVGKVKVIFYFLFFSESLNNS